jgi:hypothetical protein
MPGFLCNKLYRKEVIANIDIPDKLYESEDILLSLKVFK